MKTKPLISFAVTAKLICAFVFAQEKIRLTHDAAQLPMGMRWCSGRVQDPEARKPGFDTSAMKCP